MNNVAFQINIRVQHSDNILKNLHPVPESCDHPKKKAKEKQPEKTHRHLNVKLTNEVPSA